ncbi:MAG: orotate phosphoribosyltransferase [Treponema sp.]|nr:orotate phosphoribosyltransferase [Treponema sp.]
MEKVLELLRDSGAMLEGHFQLSSGRHSDKYFQCAKLLQYPDKAKAALAVVTEKIQLEIKAGLLKIDAVAGPAMGGIIVAYELGRQLGLPALFTERDGSGIMVLRRGFELQAGQSILIAEDVVTTGKSYRECAAALENLGVKIAAAACIVDRRQEEEESLLPFFAACKVMAANWETDDCLLCKQGIPAEKPGSRKFQDRKFQDR